MSLLKDDQLVAVMRAVLKLPIEQRTVLLRHIATRLPMYISRFTDTDFDKAVRVVLREMMVRLALQRVAQHLNFRFCLEHRSGQWVSLSGST
jgi:hypothetical protein